MVPGMFHCSGGVGPDRHDAVTALIDWVEKGKAPDTIIASKVTDGKRGAHAPALPLPQVARYERTTAAQDAAASFACSDPR